MFKTLHASIIADPWGGVLTYRFWPDKKTIAERMIALDNISGCKIDVSYPNLHQWDQVGKPERVLCLNIDCNQGREGANVDDPVKPHEKSLHGQFRINNHTFSRFKSLQNWLCILILLGAHGSHVSLDSTSSQANDDHCSDKPSKSRISLKTSWCRGGNQDSQPDDVNSKRDSDGFKFADILIWWTISNKYCKVPLEDILPATIAPMMVEA